MSTSKHIDAICIAVLILTLLITVLFMNGEALGIRKIVDEDAEAYSNSAFFTENDRNGNWDSAGATKIVLNGDRSTVSGGGAYAYDRNVMITSAGRYVVSGTLENGSIIVDSDSTSKVWIKLDGVTISCTDSACIQVEQADKVFLTLVEGTENVLISEGISAEAAERRIDAALFSRDDLTVNGSGSLTVSSAGHGIAGNDDLIIAGGVIAVTALRDGLHANEHLRITDAAIRLEAGDDGASVSGDVGDFYMESGSLNIQSTGNGLTALSALTVAGGDLEIDSGNDGMKADGDISITGGNLKITAYDDGVHSETAITVSGGSIVIPSCREGIEAVTVEISGGDMEVDAGSDGITAEKELRITGGNLKVTASDDGLHSDTAIAISGGTVLIPSCYEGLEAVTIDISGGEIEIYPEDDGLNANGAGGGVGFMGGGFGGRPGNRSDGTGLGDRPGVGEKPEQENGTPPERPEGMGQFDPQSGGTPEMPGRSENTEPGTGIQTASAGEETWIHISGGSVTVVNKTARDADGLDSNGDIIISGGTVRVSLVNSGSNSALDCGSENGGILEISGGNVIACGSYAMAEGFDPSSTQCSVLYNFQRGAGAGTAVSLEDEDGKILLAWEVPCSYSSVALSCPGMKIGGTYTVVVGDYAEEITLEDVSASFGDAQSEGFVGPMNWGGMQFRDRK